MNRISFLIRGYPFQGLIAVILDIRIMKCMETLSRHSMIKMSLTRSKTTISVNCRIACS